MLELDEDQLKQLDLVRQDELLENLLLEVRQRDPGAFKPEREDAALGYLCELREEARGFGLQTLNGVEHFLRLGLMYPGFSRHSGFRSWMQRRVVDSQEQRLRDFERVIDFVRERQTWYLPTNERNWP